MHRDIKPANVILREGDRLVLIDFGATRQATRAARHDLSPRSIPAATGRPSRCLACRRASSPTSMRSGRCATGRSAAPLWTRWRGRIRWRPDGRIRSRRPRSIGAGRYPPTLLAAIDAALAVDPARRPQSVDAMLGILRPDEPAGVPSDPAPAPDRARCRSPRTRRNRVARDGRAGRRGLGRCRVSHAEQSWPRRRPRSPSAHRCRLPRQPRDSGAGSARRQTSLRRRPKPQPPCGKKRHRRPRRRLAAPPVPASGPAPEAGQLRRPAAP